MILHPQPFVLNDFLDRPSCRRLRAAMDRGAVELAEILGDTPTLDTGVRHAASIEIDANLGARLEQRLDAARDQVARHFGVELHGREGASCLRYTVGGYYRPHVDRARVAAWPDALRRRIAIVVFLNDDFAGGELSLIDAGLEIAPREGTLVAFDAGVLHEVLPVTRGTRDVVVDWFYDPAPGGVRPGVRPLGTRGLPGLRRRILHRVLP